MQITFNDLSKMWLEKEMFNKTYSYRTELICSVKHLSNYLGNQNCSDIKSQDIDEFIHFESETLNPNTNKPYSKKTLSDHLYTGNLIFEFGLENSLIDCPNPFAKKKKKIPKDAPVNERLPIDSKTSSLILSVEHRAQVAAIIMLFCGLRKGEIIPLKWSDIDLRNKTIHITKSVKKIDSNNYEVKRHTKNGKDRHLPIPDGILPLLKIEKFGKKDDELIFSKKDGSLHTDSSWKSMWNSYQKALNYEYYRRYMVNRGKKPKPYCSPTGIPVLIDKFTAHQLRHTYCTMLYYSGVDALSASKLMGHSNVRITLEIYTHLDEIHKLVNIEKFNQYITSSYLNTSII